MYVAFSQAVRYQPQWIVGEKYSWQFIIHIRGFSGILAFWHQPLSDWSSGETSPAEASTKYWGQWSHICSVRSFYSVKNLATSSQDMTQPGRSEQQSLTTWNRTCWINGSLQADCAEATCRCTAWNPACENFINWHFKVIKLKYDWLHFQQQLPHTMTVPLTPLVAPSCSEEWSTAVCNAVVIQMFSHDTETSQSVRGF